MRIESPEHFSSGAINCVHNVERGAEVDHTIHDYRLHRKTHVAVDRDRPSEAQTVNVLVRNALQRTEVLGLKVSAAHQPVVATVGLGQHPRLRDIASSREESVGVEAAAASECRSSISAAKPMATLSVASAA